MRARIQVRLQFSRQLQIHAPVSRLDIPFRLYLRSPSGPGRDTPISCPYSQRVEPPFDIDMPISRRRIHLPIQVPTFNRPISRMQPNIPLHSLYRNMTVPCLNIQASIDRIRFHGSVSRRHFQVRILRHMHFHTQIRMIRSPMESPVSHRLGHHFYAVSILRRAHPQVLIQRVPAINHANLHLFNIARRHSHRAVVGLHSHTCASAHGICLGVLIRPRCRCSHQEDHPRNQGTTPRRPIHRYAPHSSPPPTSAIHVTQLTPQMFLLSPLLLATYLPRFLGGFLPPGDGNPGVNSFLAPLLFYRFAAFFFAPGFCRSASKNSFVGKVLITSFFSSHPLLAIVTPYRRRPRFAVLCESVEITTFIARSLHIRRYTSFKSSRSGYELHSIATPCLAHASSTFSMSYSNGSLRSSSRPVGCAIICVYGFSIAASILSVIAARSKLKYEWIEHTTTSSWAKIS